MTKVRSSSGMTRTNASRARPRSIMTSSGRAPTGSGIHKPAGMIQILPLCTLSLFHPLLAGVGQAGGEAPAMVGLPRTVQEYDTAPARGAATA